LVARLRSRLFQSRPFLPRLVAPLAPVPRWPSVSSPLSPSLRTAPPVLLAVIHTLHPSWSFPRRSSFWISRLLPVAVNGSPLCFFLSRLPTFDDPLMVFPSPKTVLPRLGNLALPDLFLPFHSKGGGGPFRFRDRRLARDGPARSFCPWSPRFPRRGWAFSLMVPRFLLIRSGS